MTDHTKKLKELIAEIEARNKTPEGKLAQVNSMLYRMFEMYVDCGFTDEQRHKFGLALKDQFEIMEEMYNDTVH
jgi:hypothetical protein